MGTNHERPAISKNYLNLAERGQAILKKLGASGVEQFFVGSNSPAYVQAQWRKQPEISPIDITTAKVKGDDEIGFLRGKFARNWHRVAVFAINANFYLDTIDEYKDAEPAVAYVSERVVRVGQLPKGTGFGFRDKQRQMTMAMRRGPDPLEASMGLWLPKERQLITPDVIQVLERDLSDTLLPRVHPGTPLF